MAETAFAYVPKACDSQACRVHVAFHGCRQSAAEYPSNQLYFRDVAGYNEAADNNRIIVLYPQIRARNRMQSATLDTPYNPRGCWDFWGYSGVNFYQKGATQLAAVKAMVERLVQPR